MNISCSTIAGNPKVFWHEDFTQHDHFVSLVQQTIKDVLKHIYFSPTFSSETRYTPYTIIALKSTFFACLDKRKRLRPCLSLTHTTT